VVVIGKNEKFLDQPNILVAAEYPNLAKKIFKKAKIRPSGGGTEQKLVELGKYDFGVCVTETGKSINENGLKIVKVILESPVTLIARKFTPQIKLLGELLLGALNSEKYMLLKMNVEKRFYGSIINFIPALRSPTISRLLRGGYAIEAVVKKDGLADLVILLRQKGGTGITTQRIDMVL
jgi:ATP phosphoribosyltransferase-like protein